MHYVEYADNKGEGFYVSLEVCTFCKNLFVNPEVARLTSYIRLFYFFFSSTSLLYFSTIKLINPLWMDPIIVCRHTFSKKSVICGLVTFF